MQTALVFFTDPLQEKVRLDSLVSWSEVKFLREIYAEM